MAMERDTLVKFKFESTNAEGKDCILTKTIDKVRRDVEEAHLITLGELLAVLIDEKSPIETILVKQDTI